MTIGIDTTTPSLYTKLSGSKIDRPKCATPKFSPKRSRHGFSATVKGGTSRHRGEAVAKQKRIRRRRHKNKYQLETVNGGFNHPFPHLLEWRFEECASFVAIGCGLRHYKETFERNVLTGHDLLSMDASRLCAIGVKDAKDQELILRSIKYLIENGKNPPRALGVKFSHQKAPTRSMGELPTLRQQMADAFHRGTAHDIKAPPPSFPKAVKYQSRRKFSNGTLDFMAINNPDALEGTQMVKRAMRRSLGDTEDAEKASLFLEGLRAREEIRETRKYRKPRQKIDGIAGIIVQKGKRGIVQTATESRTSLLPAIGKSAYQKDMGHYETVNSNSMMQVATMGNFGPGMTPIADMRYDRMDGIIV
jgi:hypothetical protein